MASEPKAPGRRDRRGAAPQRDPTHASRTLGRQTSIGPAIVRRSRHARSLLPVAAISPDGLLVTSTGSYVRYLQTGSVNPFVIDSPETERICSAFAQISARLPDGQSLQLYADARALHVENLLALERARCEHAAGVASEQGRSERAAAIRALGDVHERSIADTARELSPLQMRYLVVCPWRAPAGAALAFM